MKTIKFHILKTFALTIVLAILILINGCSSSQGIIKFSTLKYPTSMSAFLYDQNQNLVMKGKELETLHTFEFKKSYRSLAYGLIPLTQKESLSDSLNAIVGRYNGDGIINLTVTIEQGVVNKVYSFFMYLPSYIPVLPSSARITVTGEIVKLKYPESSYLPDKGIKSNYIPKENIPQEINKVLDETN